MPRGVPRDPNIKQHSAATLRRHADAFDAKGPMLVNLANKQAKDLAAKAIRYRRQADKLDAQEKTRG